MPGTTYHVLPEAEPFSEFHGGAISRWAANIIRNRPASVVVCVSADESWKVAPESVHVLRGLAHYQRWRRYIPHLPWPLHCRIIRHIFAPLVKRVCSGDIVWIHNRPEFALALTAPVRRAGGQIVLHLHNAHLVEGPETLMRRVRVDRLVFVSDFLLQQARNKFPSLGAASVVYSGADEAIFYPPERERESSAMTIVLFAGRLVKEKGIHILLDAMKLLGLDAVPLRAQIVGSSSFGHDKETEYIKALKSTSPPTVQFLSYRSGPELGDLFRRADIFCSPAVWDEPFGLVNVEALASGLPVVSTLSGGSREILGDGGGVLVERGSAIQLASALRQLVENPAQRKHLGLQGYSIFRDRFTWSRARTQVQEIEEMLGRGAPAAPAGLKQ